MDGKLLWNTYKFKNKNKIMYIRIKTKRQNKYINDDTDDDDDNNNNIYNNNNNKQLNIKLY